MENSKPVTNDEACASAFLFLVMAVLAVGLFWFWLSPHAPVASEYPPTAYAVSAAQDVDRITVRDIFRQGGLNNLIRIRSTGDCIMSTDANAIVMSREFCTVYMGSVDAKTIDK